MAKILLIEDDQSILFLGQKVLEMAGHKVVTAYDSETALEAFSAGSFDLVITDLQIPGQNGIRVVGKIRASKASQPVIIMSGGDLNSDEFQAAQEKFGAIYVLAKPFDLEKFSEAVDQTINKKKIHQTTGF